MVRVLTGHQAIARLVFEMMTQVIHKTYMPDMRFGTFLELVPVGYAIVLRPDPRAPNGIDRTGAIFGYPEIVGPAPDRLSDRTRAR
jgi:hypothetical protein